MKETIETEYGQVTVATITVAAARAAQLPGKKGDEFNDAFLVESLKAGGHEDAQHVLDGLGFFDEFQEVNKAALRVNGLKVPTKGEDRPAGPATAESTLSTSTAPSDAGTGTA